MEYREKIKQLRKEHGETQKELADALGVAYTTYKEYETGKSQFPFYLIPTITNRYGVDVTVVLEDAENVPDDNSYEVCNEGKYRCKFLMDGRCLILTDTTFDNGCTFYKEKEE